MSLPPALRSLLLNGPGPSHYDPLRYGGSAVVRAAWGRHKAELIAACKPGTRPWAFWRIQLGIPKPAGEAGQLRLIKKLELYRDEAEKAYVLERLEEITARHPRRQGATPGARRMTAPSDDNDTLDGLRDASTTPWVEIKEKSRSGDCIRTAQR